LSLRKRLPGTATCTDNNGFPLYIKPEHRITQELSNNALAACKTGKSWNSSCSCRTNAENFLPLNIVGRRPSNGAFSFFLPPKNSPSCACCYVRSIDAGGASVRHQHVELLSTKTTAECITVPYDPVRLLFVIRKSTSAKHSFLIHARGKQPQQQQQQQQEGAPRRTKLFTPPRTFGAGQIAPPPPSSLL